MMQNFDATSPYSSNKAGISSKIQTVLFLSRGYISALVELAFLESTNRTTKLRAS
jgi:hypothetical protein